MLTGRSAALTDHKVFLDRLTSVRRNAAVQTAQSGLNRISIKDTPAPGSPAHRLKRRPQPGFLRQIRVSREVRSRRSFGQDTRSLLRSEHCLALAHQINAAFQL